MAGIYVHIPFCQRRCIYCGFCSSTLLPLRERYVSAVISELSQRLDYLGGEQVETVYLGGGTPSLLPEESLRRLLGALPLPSSSGEVTMECNPDDVSPRLVETMKETGVNRVSMGVQTFDDERLKFLRRRHNAKQALEAVATLRRGGISNISIDLMFGLPGQKIEDWLADIDTAIGLNVEHISAYSLMYEEGTPLFKMLESGEVQEIDEDESRTMYYSLIDRLTAAGYEHYEISNFCRPGRRSKHNSSYWNDVPYLGLGAGAHSYDRCSRQWNTEDVELYINNVESGILPFQREEIDDITHYNDTIVTALRTAEGITLASIPQYSATLQEAAKPFIDGGLLSSDGSHLRLTREGLYVSDSIMRELII